jgi:hypothetical protein
LNQWYGATRYDSTVQLLCFVSTFASQLDFVVRGGYTNHQIFFHVGLLFDCSFLWLFTLIFLNCIEFDKFWFWFWFVLSDVEKPFFLFLSRILSLNHLNCSSFIWIREHMLIFCIFAYFDVDLYLETFEYLAQSFVASAVARTLTNPLDVSKIIKVLDTSPNIVCDSFFNLFSLSLTKENRTNKVERGMSCVWCCGRSSFSELMNSIV